MAACGCSTVRDKQPLSSCHKASSHPSPEGFEECFTPCQVEQLFLIPVPSRDPPRAAAPRACCSGAAPGSGRLPEVTQPVLFCFSLCPHSSSQDGGPPHHHTVHLGSTQAPCIHCSRRKRHPLQRQGRSKEGKSRMHPGETTVFSVGRYPNEFARYLPAGTSTTGSPQSPFSFPLPHGLKVPLLCCTETPQQQLCSWSS